jgi:superfamily II DNA or RNA helicase
MTATIMVNNVWIKISGIQDVKLVDDLDGLTSFFVQGYQYMKAFREGFFDRKTRSFRHWDGKKHLLTQKMVLPAGLLSMVIEFLDERGISWQIDDRRLPVTHGEPLQIRDYEPREYQKEAVETAIARGRGILRVGTGGGKTLISAMIAAHYNIPTCVFVVGKDLLYQFHREFSKMFDMPIGLIGDGRCVIRRINICSVWTAITAFDLKAQVSLDDEDWNPEVIEINAKQKIAIKEVIERANLAIYDEAHFLATSTIQSIFKASKNCRYLFGMSGTPFRDDGADILLESVCGPRIYNMPSSKLISMGFLVPPKIVLYETPPMEDASSKNYASVYSSYIVHNPTRNSMIVDAARMLISKGRKVLILVRYLNHGRELASMLSDIPLYFVNGEVDSETREEVKQLFESGELKCLIASSIFDIGVDIPKLDAIILGGGGKSTVRTLQRIGRVIRPSEGKIDAFVVDFIDNARYLDKHSATRITVYETEPAFKIKFPKDFDQASIKRIKKINDRLA